ncbi:class IIb bacteriocin, lactobin A/cerein 7B family [Janthinobacterium sp. TND4EL3]|uniref:class IIb bacteriocin, lactobin A/cerein 7B family n=1 Tax=Janthinobacterium sp. TND4EL3 TaxID=1907311 RepID=UPI000954D25B|nr:class IIb bacteriocin, lactobin A/cerein 7B family [Janthinobacterium sp. TND4EL3]SIP93410.1 class IIb bacteriocin, lactobin A/cerein 7B family [Janthinobacterium sp. TND4EL3]
MKEMSNVEVEQVSGGIPIVLAGPAIALATAGFAAFSAGVAAGYTMVKDYYAQKNVSEAK